MAKGHVGIQIKSHLPSRKSNYFNHTVKTAESSQLLWDVFTGSIVLIHILLASLQLEDVKVKSR